jgi:hypothetical protein
MSGKVALEEGVPEETFSDLSKMGHPVCSVSPYDRALFGRGKVIYAIQPHEDKI